MKYKLIDEDAVRAEFRRSRGKADTKQISESQAVTAIINSVLQETVIEQARDLKRNGSKDSIREAGSQMLREMEPKAQEAKVLADSLGRQLRTDPVPQLIEALEDRLRQMEMTHVAYSEIKANHADYEENRTEISEQIEIIEAAIKAVDNKLSSLSNQAKGNRQQRRQAPGIDGAPSLAEASEPTPASTKKKVAKKSAAKKSASKR